MSISSSTRKAGPYSCNGATVAFPFAFKVFTTSDVRVVLTYSNDAESDLALGTNYTVALNTNQDANPGGTVTTTAAYATGNKITLTSQVQNLQPVTLTNQGGFYPKVINDALDRATVQIQQLAEQVGRAVKTPISSGLSPDQLIADLYAVEANAGISATAASGSATAAANSATAAEAAKNAMFSMRVFATAFGAVGNGVSDDTTALQNAINYAKSIGAVLDLGGAQYTYKITTALIGGSNLHVRSSGATINMSAIASGEKTALVFAGSIGTGVAISSGASENSYTINVANTSSFAVGDYVQVASDDYYTYGAGAYNVAKGEIHRIRSIVANTSITFTTPLVDTYTTSPKVYPITWAENVSVKGVKIIGLDIPATSQRGIALRYVKNFDISENEFSAQDFYQVECASSIVGRINGNRFTGVYYDGVTGTIFYGVAILDCSQWVEVAGNIGDKVRHLVVTVSKTAGQGFYGQPYWINIHNNISYDSMAGGGGRSYAYEQHGFGRYLVWAGNQAHGCYAGFNIDGGQDNVFIGNQISGYGYQGLIIGEAGTKTKNLLVANNTIDNYTGEVTSGFPCGIRIETSDEMSGITIKDNVLTNCTSIASPNIGQGMSIGSSTVMRDVLIKNNNMTTRLGIESAGTYAIVTASSVKARFVGNECLGWRNGIAIFGDGCQVEGGSVRNYSVGGTGYGLYSNADRTIFKNVHLENINYAIRLDTSSTNCLATANTMTGCTVTTPSNAGTGNTTTGNFVV